MAIQAALVPVSIGLIGASAAVIARAAAQNWVAVAVMVVTAVVTYTIRVNPLWIFAGAAVLGLGRIDVRPYQVLLGLAER